MEQVKDSKKSDKNKDWNIEDLAIYKGMWMDMREIKFRVWIVSDEYPKGIMVFPEYGKCALLEKCSQSKYGILPDKTLLK